MCVFRIITDLELADELWKEGLLWAFETESDEVPPEEGWWLMNDYTPYTAGNLYPTKWVDIKRGTGKVWHYAVQVEE